MQLFAIVARPGGGTFDRRVVVESFLIQQLNRDIADQYLLLFDEHLQIIQQKLYDSDKHEKILSLNSVKVLKICKSLNAELTQRQKVVILIRLWEFVNTDGKLSEQEREFVFTIAETFNIDEVESELIYNFVATDFKGIKLNTNILLIDGKQDGEASHRIYIRSKGLEGEVKVLEVASAKLHILRSASLYELKIGGQLLNNDKCLVLKNGVSIREHRMETIYYSEIVAAFTRHTRHIKFILEAEQISYIYPKSKFGIQPMSFSLHSGELVSILGGSGSGKSTLLNVLNGKYRPQNGTVKISGVDLTANDESLTGLIGYVSQDDRLIEDLTVFQNLYYTASLCFRDLNKLDLFKLCLDTLGKLELLHLKDQMVGTPMNKKISGGQRKRLNIALELIREPAILYLDEPTSGLSSRDSENIMDLLKELSLKGKLIVTVIHQPSSTIFKMFDRLLVVDQGGHLIYDGNPVESIMYFKTNTYHANWSEYECLSCGTVTPEQIFDIVEANVLDEYGNVTPDRKITAMEWYAKWKNHSLGKITTKAEDDQIPEKSFNKPGRFRQFTIFFMRDVQSKLARRQYLLLNLLLTPVMAFLLTYIFRYSDVSVAGYTYGGNQNIPIYLFMAIIIALFVGLTTSGEEIIKDRKTVDRESFLNLSRGGYLLSKVLVLLIISAVQACMFTLIGNSILEVKGMFFEYWLMLFSCWVFANLLGLNISDAMKWTVNVYILIPFIIIPQIIMSGVLVKYDKLNPSILTQLGVPVIGEFVTARWAFEGLAVKQHLENEYHRTFGTYDKLISQAQFKLNFLIPELKSEARSLKGGEKSVLISTELKKEMGRNPGLIQDLKDYNASIAALEKFYGKVLSIAVSKKDSLVETYLEINGDGAFRMLKQSYYNESLSDFVRNNDNPKKMLTLTDQIVQMSDPIYKDNSDRFFQSHFLASKKDVLSFLMDTYWANLIIICLSIVAMYVLLYYRILKQLVEPIKMLRGRRK
jgi:ABC transport system ATP-binding/permease protein